MLFECDNFIGVCSYMCQAIVKSNRISVQILRKIQTKIGAQLSLKRKFIKKKTETKIGHR